MSTSKILLIILAIVALVVVVGGVAVSGTYNTMHRVDLAQATGEPLELTPNHDGRLVADVVRDWADRHGRPFRLELDGPAGGSFAVGVGGEEHSLDAVEFCRILSGRGTGPGLLATRVLF